MAITGVNAMLDSAFAAILDSNIIPELRPAMTSRAFLRMHPGGASRVAQWTIYGDPGAGSSTGDDLTDFTSTAASDTSTTTTADEVGFRIDVSDLAKETVVQNLVSDMTAMVARSIAESWETTLAALVDDFSNVTAAASTLTPVDFLAAVSALEQRDVPGPYGSYLDPKQSGDLRAEIATTTASYEVGGRNADLVQPFETSGFFGKYMGVPIFQTSLVVGTAPIGGAVLALGSADRPALGGYEVRPPRIETQRDASQRSLEIVGSQAFAMVEIVDGSGQTLTSV